MKHTILVVEDNQLILSSNCEYLEQIGYGVDGSATADDAKERVRQKRYSLVLSDVRLKGTRECDGLQLVDFIQRKRPGTPIILLTACGDPDVHLSAIRSGVSRVLDKPVPLAQIASVIRDTLFQTYGPFLG
jgi:DNA-binding NtrC family response regulator